MKNVQSVEKSALFLFMKKYLGGVKNEHYDRIWKET